MRFVKGEITLDQYREMLANLDTITVTQSGKIAEPEATMNQARVPDTTPSPYTVTQNTSPDSDSRTYKRSHLAYAIILGFVTIGIVLFIGPLNFLSTLAGFGCVYNAYRAWKGRESQ